VGDFGLKINDLLGEINVIFFDKRAARIATSEQIIAIFVSHPHETNALLVDLLLLFDHHGRQTSSCDLFPAPGWKKLYHQDVSFQL